MQETINPIITQQLSAKAKHPTVLGKRETWGIIPSAIRRWVIKEKISCFTGPMGCKKLSKLRGPIRYHDSLLYSMRDPWMRQLRKLRLGVSDLLDHTHFLNEFIRNCTRCNSGEEHFFIRCTAHAIPRMKYFCKLQVLGVTDLDNVSKIMGLIKN